MTAYSYLTEKVARSPYLFQNLAKKSKNLKGKVLIVILLTVNSLAWAQSSSASLNNIKITLSCENILFEDFLLQLGKQGNVYFIYSSNMIDLKQHVSFSFYQEPLPEVLDQLASRLHLIFKQQENHIIIKNNSIATANAITTNGKKNNYNKSYGTKDSFLISERSVPARDLQEHDELPVLFLHGVTTINLQIPTIDTSLLYKHPSVVYPKSRLHNRWNTSVSLFANEYSGGLEVHSGFPFIFGVLNAGWQYNGNYKPGYGIGSSLHLSSIFFGQIIYTFTKIKQNTINNIDISFGNYIKNPGQGIDIYYNQHSIKTTLHYKLNNKIMIRVGPSINFQRISNIPSREYVISKNTLPASQSVVANFNHTVIPQGNANVLIPVTEALSTIPMDNQPKLWVGFDLGISYSVKFFSNK